jgi:phage terminase small subunit
MALNDKQRKFAYEYVIDFNATDAAKRAGYSVQTAYSQGQRLLKHVEVADLIDKLKNKALSNASKTREDVVKHLEDIVDLYMTTGKFAANAIRALEILNKMHGWNEPDKQEITHKGLTINYVKPKDKDNQQGD